METGFILIHRKITKWEWYRNPNTFRVFLHCLLMANFTDGRFEGKDVRRGQFITSLPNLAKQTSLTIQQVRTALEHLKSTGEITDTATRHYRIITVVKYDDYQNDNRQDNRQLTDNQQTANRQSTDNQQQYNNNNNNNKNNNDNKVTIKRFVPPTVDEVAEYCQQRNNGINAQHFIDYYTQGGWVLKNGKKMVDWKAAVRTWEGNGYHNKPSVKAVPAQAYGQRNYDGEQEDAMKRMLEGVRA